MKSKKMLTIALLTSALVNFRFIANTVWTTSEAVQKINGSK